MDWTINMEGGGTLYVRDDGAYLYFEARRPDENQGLYRVIVQGLHGTQVLGTMLPSESGYKLSRMISRQTVGQWGCLPVTRGICEKIQEFSPVFSEKRKEKPKDEGGYQGDFSISPQHRNEKREKILSFDQSEEIPSNLRETSWEVVEQKGGGSDFQVLEEKMPESKDYIQDEIWIPVEEQEEFLSFSPEKGIQDPLIAEKIRSLHGVLRTELKEGFELAFPFYKNKEFPLTSLFCFGKLIHRQGNDYILYTFNGEGQPTF